MRDLSKLPQWARQEIERLTANIASLQRDLAQARGEGSSETRVTLRGDMLQEHGLPDHARVMFHFGPRQVIEVYRRHNALEVYSSAGRLVVRPESGNVISVRPEDF